MAMKARTLVGLDVHARQTHAAILDRGSGELRVTRLQIPPIEVAGFLEGLAPVAAVYEAGPTGFGLARAARQRGVDVRVAAPGSIPKGSGDPVKTDRRDAIRLVRLLAAGELSFAFVASVADEQFRDLVRAIEDVRGDLMRSRHRLGKFLLRRGERYGGPGGAWTTKHMAWLRALHFVDACSQATLVDYLSAVELLVGRRASLIIALESAIPESSHAAVIARSRCFRGIDTSDTKRRQGSITKAGPRHARRLLVEAAHHYRHHPSIGATLARRQHGHGRTRHRDRLARPAASAPALAATARPAPQARWRRRDRLRARAGRIPLGSRHA
jgi:transposase